MNKKQLYTWLSILKSQGLIEWFDISWSKKDKNCDKYQICFNSYHWVTHFVNFMFWGLENKTIWDFNRTIRNIIRKEL